MDLFTPVTLGALELRNRRWVDEERIVATNDSAPLVWAGDDADLPQEGWDGQFLRTVADLAAGRPQAGP